MPQLTTCSFISRLVNLQHPNHNAVEVRILKLTTLYMVWFPGKGQNEYEHK